MSKSKNCDPGVNVRLKEIDELTFSTIRRMILKIFSVKKMPTMWNVHKKVWEDQNFPNYSFKTMIKIVEHLHFKYTSRKCKNEIVGRHRIQLWCIYYLEKIQQLRKAGKFIYYLDEVVLTEGTAAQVDSNQPIGNSGKIVTNQKRLIACHIGSEEGFLDGGSLVVEAKKGSKHYKKEMTDDVFEDWFKNILPKLKENSVIILDSATCHSRRAVETPDMLSPKSQVYSWLDSYNIKYNKDLYKVELLCIVQKEKHKYVSFVLDEMAAKRGITVLRTPPYYGKLNPMQTILYEIKDYFKDKSCDVAEAKQLLCEKTSEIPLAKWKELIEIAVKEEEWLFKLGYVIDDVTDENTECMSSGDEDEDEEYDKEYEDFVSVLDRKE